MSDIIEITVLFKLDKDHVVVTDQYDKRYKVNVSNIINKNGICYIHWRHLEEYRG